MSKTLTKSSGKNPIPIPKVYDSTTLAMYPIAPVARIPKYDLVRQEDGVEWHTNRVEWSGIHPETGENTTWFVERRIIQGTPVLPNYKTQQVLNALLHIFLEQAGENLGVAKIRISASEVLRVMNGKESKGYKPGAKQITMVMNHINSLRNMRISYGYLDSKEKNEWFISESNIIGDIDMVVRKGRRSVKQSYSEGEVITQDVKVSEVKSITFSPGFISKYLAERITYDLFPYLRLDSPTAQNAYRFLNYLIQTADDKDFNYKDDLQKFCRVHLALQNKKTEDTSKASRLAADMRKELEPIRQLWEGDFAIYKDSKHPSGYAISFGQRPRLFDIPEDIKLTLTEKECYKLLRYFGVYHIPAMDVILHCRKAFYQGAGDYIMYCIKQFDALRRKGEIKAPPEKTGGVLLSFIKKDYHYEDFLQDLSADKNDSYKPDLTFTATPINGDYNFNDFKKRYPAPYLEIQERVSQEVKTACGGDSQLANSDVFIFAAIRAECYKYYKKHKK